MTDYQHLVLHQARLHEQEARNEQRRIAKEALIEAQQAQLRVQPREPVQPSGERPAPSARLRVSSAS
ncbi:MAG: hypothetical protein ACOYL5_20875 [Phototrophicaceae bacterium]